MEKGQSRWEIEERMAPGSLSSDQKHHENCCETKYLRTVRKAATCWKGLYQGESLVAPQQREPRCSSSCVSLYAGDMYFLFTFCNKNSSSFQGGEVPLPPPTVSLSRASVGLSHNNSAVQLHTSHQSNLSKAMYRKTLYNDCTYRILSVRYVFLDENVIILSPLQTWNMKHRLLRPLKWPFRHNVNDFIHTWQYIHWKSHNSAAIFGTWWRGNSSVDSVGINEHFKDITVVGQGLHQEMI